MAELEIAAVGPQAVADLERELARRGEDQRAGAFRFIHAIVPGEMLQQRQAEGRRLAGAGLGDAEHIAARKTERNGLRLDRGRMGIVLGRESAQERLGDAEGCKR